MLWRELADRHNLEVPRAKLIVDLVRKPKFDLSVLRNYTHLFLEVVRALQDFAQEFRENMKPRIDKLRRLCKFFFEDIVENEVDFEFDAMLDMLIDATASALHCGGVE